MAKLQRLGSRVSALAPRIKPRADVEGHDRTVEHWRSWYSLKAWSDLRAEVFVRDDFTCQWPGCGQMIVKARDRIADHKQPHRGDPRLFWDRTNVWTLCKTCHDTHKQAAERGFQCTA